ncbi:phosphodiesterase [Mesobacillus campisalis]|uniref:Phosphoesterase n=1 Tax=Mesobacillus campisalis TaxID=1408103 RepID=A0A0M2ST21_9BACI|nr:metallophosphoesterase [Mesobacillus campisalis]KKK37283.1 phosphodiesterase [Mesobacillus campisalis]
MKIVVVSDTHIPKRAKKFPQPLICEMETADLIIHAGDWQTFEVYQELSAYGNVTGVTGNVDSPELGRVLNSRELVAIEGFKIGVVHGHGRGKSTVNRAKSAFAGEKVDCIIFGHSHIPMYKEEDGVILFNPGSATDKRRQGKFSFGLINLGNTIEAHHIYYPDKE